MAPTDSRVIAVLQILSRNMWLLVLKTYGTDLWQRLHWIEELEDKSVQYVAKVTYDVNAAILEDFNTILDPTTASAKSLVCSRASFTRDEQAD